MKGPTGFVIIRFVAVCRIGIRRSAIIFRSTGHVKGMLHVTGFPWSPSYLVAHRDHPVLFEAGFHCMGRIYEREVRNVLGGTEPQVLFLTHVHYDHCGAAGYLKKAFPGLSVMASARAAEIMSRPNALDLMVSLSANVLPIVASTDGIDASLLLGGPFEAFSVDRVIGEGDVIAAGDDLSVCVYATPGHTRDMLTYYLPEHRILIATESAGVQGQTGHVVSEFLVDFDAYVRSLRLFLSLDIDVLCQGHHFVFVGDDVRPFLNRSVEAVERFRERVENALEEESGDVDRVVRRIKSWEYDPNPGPKQPEKAYLLNLRTRVAHLAGRRKEAQGQASSVTS